MKTSTERPKYLYKYRPWSITLEARESGTFDEINYTEKLLKESCFYCQCPHDFDDPHDSSTGPTVTGSPLDIDRFVIEKMAPVVNAMKATGAKSLVDLGKMDDQRAFEALSKIAGQNMRKACRVLSLSSESECELMWAFYSDNHQGICLEFDGNHPFFEAIRPVSYSTEPPVSEANSFDELIFCKSAAWSHQSEWRLITERQSLKFPAGLLRRVIIGYRFPEPQYQSLVDSLIIGGHEVVIDQMQRIPETYYFNTVERGRIFKKPNAS